MRLILQAHPLDDHARGKDDQTGPRRLQAGLGLGDPGMGPGVEVEHAVADRAGEQLAEEGAGKGGQADGHADLGGVEVVDGAEGGAACDGEEDAAEAEGDAVVDRREHDGGVLEHEEYVRDISKAEAALDVHAREGEELEPGAGGLQGASGEGVPVVERLGQAEEIEEPVGGDDDGGDPVAPSPADVFGREAAGDGGDVGAVCYARAKVREESLA